MPGPQNLLTYSEQLDAASWSTQSASITANQTTAPDGTLSADLFTDTNDGGVTTWHAVYQSVSSRGGAAHALSVYAKDASGGASPWLFLSTDGGAAGVTFNVATGAVGTVFEPATSTGARLLDYGV
ncbi:MAG TPA: hypothetical protein VHC45_15070, partial [Gaiellaceae bacterium]|nr:hypothetical protein [Gaiellaceae bacterium]